MNSFADDPDAVPIRPAATVIALRDGAAGLEVLVVRRDTNLAFHGGSWVFPGGRVDDHEISDSDDDMAAARLAAAREAHEEAGLVVEPSDLIPLSHWTTPWGRNRRFATWFFVVAAPAGEVVIDDSEIRAYEWHTLDAAISGSDAGDIQLAAPTYISLRRLRAHQRVTDALETTAARPNEIFLPKLVRTDAGLWSVYQDDAGYESGNLDTPGPRHRTQMLDAGFDYENTVDPPI
ncbi:MAG: NUDIX domain-containing protein [Actinomycetota bacterium]